jgi:hypothetical protein
VSRVERRADSKGFQRTAQRARLGEARYSAVAIAEETELRALRAGREAAERRGMHLRGDAELLILFLARDLVAHPVATVTPQDANAAPETVAEDVATVVGEASERAEDGEVSAHAIIDGLSVSWERLKSSRFRVWDRHRNGIAEEEERPRHNPGPEAKA